jgi:hypothetical protein
MEDILTSISSYQVALNILNKITVTEENRHKIVPAKVDIHTQIHKLELKVVLTRAKQNSQ